MGGDENKKCIAMNKQHLIEIQALVADLEIEALQIKESLEG